MIRGSKLEKEKRNEDKKERNEKTIRIRWRTPLIIFENDFIPFHLCIRETQDLKIS